MLSLNCLKICFTLCEVDFPEKIWEVKEDGFLLPCCCKCPLATLALLMRKNICYC